MSAKPLRTKDETADALVEIVNILEKATDPQYNVKFIQADWEVNFATRTFRPNYSKEGSNSKKQYPGTAKPMWWQKANRTIPTMSRTALIAAEMPKGYWDKASLWAIYTKNRLLRKALPKGMTPIELLIPETEQM